MKLKGVIEFGFLEGKTWKFEKYLTNDEEREQDREYLYMIWKWDSLHGGFKQSASFTDHVDAIEYLYNRMK